MRPKLRSTWMLPVKSVAFGACVFLLGSAAEWLTVRNVHGLLAFVDDLAAGIAAGVAVLLYERWRQREIERKLQTIRLMNHHVRNALQVISAFSYGVDGTEQPRSRSRGSQTNRMGASGSASRRNGTEEGICRVRSAVQARSTTGEPPHRARSRRPWRRTNEL